MIKLEVITDNPSFDGEGGFHEIHNISCPSNYTHVLNTIESIVINNINNNDDCPIFSVNIRCNKPDICKKLVEHYKYNSADLKFNIDEME